MLSLCLICSDFRIFCVLKYMEIRKNPENSHACDYCCVNHQLLSPKLLKITYDHFGDSPATFSKLVAT